MLARVPARRRLRAPRLAALGELGRYAASPYRLTGIGGRPVGRDRRSHRARHRRPRSFLRASMTSGRHWGETSNEVRGVSRSGRAAWQNTSGVQDLIRIDPAIRVMCRSPVRVLLCLLGGQIRTDEAMHELVGRDTVGHTRARPGQRTGGDQFKRRREGRSSGLRELENRRDLGFLSRRPQARVLQTAAGSAPLYRKDEKRRLGWIGTKETMSQRDLRSSICTPS